jgi:hypothetical protein
MNQILATVVISYGSAFLLKYTTNKVTDIVVDKTTQAVKNSAKGVWKNITNQQEIKPEIEYELVSTDENNELITDKIVYVTSKMKKKSIDSSWNEI